MLHNQGFAVALSLLLAAGCAAAPATVDTSADVDAITQLVAKEIAEFSSGQTTGMDAVFTADVLVMPPNEPALRGLQAVRNWAEGLNQLFTLQGEYVTNDVTVSGDWAVHTFTGRLTMTPKGGGTAMSESVKGVHVLRRQADGTWKITQDVWNSDTPLPGGGSQ